MPTEDRRILFEPSEVYNAIFSLCRKKELKKPPPGQFVRVYTDDSDPNQVFFDLLNPQDKSTAKLTYSRDFLAAALMLLCRGCSIPLPKTASKSVMIIDSQVILRVQI